jgi:hypothetical protein
MKPNEATPEQATLAQVLPLAPTVVWVKYETGQAKTLASLKKMCAGV